MSFVLWGARKRDIQIGSQEDQSIQALRRFLPAYKRLEDIFREAAKSFEKFGKTLEEQRSDRS